MYPGVPACSCTSFLSESSCIAFKYTRESYFASSALFIANGSGTVESVLRNIQQWLWTKAYMHPPLIVLMSLLARRLLTTTSGVKSGTCARTTVDLKATRASRNSTRAYVHRNHATDRCFRSNQISAFSMLGSYVPNNKQRGGRGR
jgi:uncharacterized membrane protein